jgi:hypothetical protein
MAHLKYYKVGMSWVLSCHMGNGIGLIHLSHWKWWRPIALFPLALWVHFRGRFGRRT